MAEGSLVPKPPTMDAQWAVISKRPGTASDYGVLAASQGGLDFSDVAWEYVAGVPSADYAADLPWVTFGTHLAGGTLLLSISVQYSPAGEERDHTGRPIWPRAFFACSYSAVAERRASYQTLCQALPTWLPGENSRPIPLPVKEQPLEGHDGLYAMVEEFGFEQLAVIAAALFDGPVAVAGTAGMKLDQRLRLLDAITALLPYPIRAELSASSAVSRKITPRMRLVLTDAPADGQQVIVLGETQPPQSPAAREYHRTLLQKKENSGPDAVVSHLWKLMEPCSLSQPGQAVQLLRFLDRLPDLFKRTVSAAAGNQIDLPLALEFFAEKPADVRWMWQQLESADLDICYKLLIPLLNARGRDAEDALRRHWDTVLDQLDTLVNRQIDKAGPDLALRVLAVAEAAPPRSDLLLGRLLLPEPAPHVDTWPERIQSRVALLGRRAVPGRGDYTYTCDILRFNEVADWQAKLVLALLSRELDDPRGVERAAGWAGWLSQPNLPSDRAYPTWVEALAFAVAGAAFPGSADRVVSVISQAPAWAVPILRLAQRFKQVASIVEIPGFDHVLLNLAMTSATDSDDLGDRLADALSHRFGATQHGATVDAARVLLGGDPVDFPDSAPDARTAGYFDGLTRVFAHLQDDWPDRLQLELLRYVVPAPAGPPGSTKLSAGAVQLIRNWCEDPDRAPDLAHYIADNELGQVLLSAHERIGPDVWRRLISHDGRLRPYGSVFQLRAAAKQVISDPVTTLLRPTKQVSGESGHPEWVKGSTVLASAMYEAYLAEMKMADILTVLAQETSSRGKVTLMTAVPPPTFLPVLNEFASLIRDTPPPGVRGVHVPDAVKKQARLAEGLWVHCLWLIVENGLLGPKYASEFRQTLLDRSRYAQDTYVRIDEIFASRRRFSLRRRPNPAEVYEAWLAYDLPPEAWKPRPPRADPAAAAGGPGATTSPWPDHARSTSSRAAVTQPVNSRLPGTSSPSAPAKPSLPARIRARYSVKPRVRAEGAHTADHQNKQETRS